VLLLIAAGAAVMAVVGVALLRRGRKPALGHAVATGAAPAGPVPQRPPEPAAGTAAPVPAGQPPAEPAAARPAQATPEAAAVAEEREGAAQAAGEGRSPAGAEQGEDQSAGHRDESGGGGDAVAEDEHGDGPPAAGDGNGDEAYEHLDAEVGATAAAVESGDLDVRRAVARVAMAAAGRPDLLDRVIGTEQLMAGARLAASPSTSTVLDLLAAARRVVAGESILVGPGGVRVEQDGHRLRLVRPGAPAGDFDSVEDLARHVDLSALAAETA
jgi:hypothetical protein